VAVGAWRLERGGWSVVGCGLARPRPTMSRINLRKVCILFVDLFESYDKPRTCERPINETESCIWGNSGRRYSKPLVLQTLLSIVNVARKKLKAEMENFIKTEITRAV
jgi:hypothetical protein